MQDAFFSIQLESESGDRGATTLVIADHATTTPMIIFASRSGSPGRPRINVLSGLGNQES
jgi:hypothetical protein